jgi:malonyl-CoA/methylmalonyl-CoA synthetase
VLLTHPGVADVAVVGMPSSQWGETVAAFVVPEAVDRTAGAAAAVEAALAAWCEEHLVSYKRPRQWHVVDAIPRNALGKIQRHLLIPRP